MYAMAMMATEEKEETEDGVKEAHDVEENLFFFFSLY